MRGSRILLAAFVLSGVVVLPVDAAGAPTAVTVNTTVDSFDGSCGDGDCSLRDAVSSVSDGGSVLVPSGFYTLSVSGSGAVEEGDLDLSRPVTIARTGEGGAFLDASGLGDRVFQVDGDADVVIDGLTLFGGRGNIHGGGVRVVTGSVRLTGVTIVGGSVGEGGGGLSVATSGRATVTESLFLDNRTRGGGGGIHVAGWANVSDSAVVGNRAQVGGGIDAGAGTLLLDDVTVADNRSRTVGGGIRSGTHARLAHVTIAGNVAQAGGGVSAAAGTVAFARTIVADNLAEADPSCTSPGTSRGGNVEGATAACGFDQASDRVRTDPRLGPLRSNGGPTPTMALRAGSPAIGIGAAGCSPRDQRGAPRDVPCDAGAYERVLCLGRPVNVLGTPGDDELSGGREPDTFLGLRGDDEFQGSLADDRACGGAGNDHLIGGPGADVLGGMRGDDRLQGEDGDDRLLGGPGNDRCAGGAGNDDTLACER